ncbi:SDR family NAD(P)-dependent oxidoreductase [Anaeromicropila populeti]|uniref:Acyl transferase domain-containing protein n=1 Tax=Anaeromicropila populeti TaxID=37658 RepID=A0A1I6IZW3_9FIRM|nr:SDR family NAD(P)-dependent oxidoreductase [Anaeromicropila populeti]SFR72218.1 Acyl transferase domain-containing protein [Anaeromicropila populeti]
MPTEKTMTYTQKVTFDNYIVRDHQLYNVRTLPGVTLLDMVYRVSFDYIGSRKLELRNILFKRPVVVSENFCADVYVTLEPKQGYYQVQITSKKVMNNGQINEDIIEHMECLMYQVTEETCAPRGERVLEILNNYTKKWDMDDIYAVARKNDISHYVFMKTLGTVYQKDNQKELMHLHLSDLAEQFREQFYLHPAFLDGSTFSGSTFLLNENGAGPDAPFIPFMIKRFRAHKSLSNEIYVYGENSRENVNYVYNNDVRENDITIFNSDGEVLVEFERIVFKRIREAFLIKKLLGTGIESASTINNKASSREISLHYVCDIISNIINLPIASLDINEGFYDLGLDSADLLKIVKILEKKLEVPLYPTLLFEYSTINRLAGYLHENYKEKLLTSENMNTDLAVEKLESEFIQVNEKMISLYLQKEIGKLLGKDSSSISVEEGFYDLGLDSGELLQIVKILEKTLEVQLYPTLLFEYSTIERLANYLFENYGTKFQVLKKEHTKESKQLDKYDLLLMEPVLLKTDRLADNMTVNKSEQIILFLTEDKLVKDVAHYFKDAKVFVKELGKIEEASKAEEVITSLIVLLKEIVFEMPKNDVVVQIITDLKVGKNFAISLKGVLRTAEKENPRIYGQIIAIENLNTISSDKIARVIAQEYRQYVNRYLAVEYKDASLERYVCYLKEKEIEKTLSNVYKDNGVYVITGGMGGLGLAIARHISQKVNAHIVLLGRRRGSDIESKMQDLRDNGVNAFYFMADVTNPDEVKKVMEQVISQFGFITGIFHCAGVLHDEFLIDKDIKNVSKTLAPKVRGTYNLDLATKDINMDFIVLFSSVSAVIGNIGQVDYAGGNSYMDAFAAARNDKVRLGKRRGKTISINWTLWESEGMSIDNEAEKRLYEMTGLFPMPLNIGLEVLDELLIKVKERAVVFYGDKDKILRVNNIYLNNKADESYNKKSNAIHNEEAGHADIAIIGLSGKYPQANSMDELWNNLKIGKDCITHFPLDRWGTFKTKEEIEKYYQYGGFINNADKFDCMFFNISPRQAEAMDPQVRLFLQTAWEACEDAGFYENRKKQNFKSNSDKCVGVFAGVFWNDYDILAADMSFQGMPTSLGINTASVPNMVSYAMNFHGPSISVNTMCSSSLTAIHLACESLKQGECNFALAGGVNVVTHPHKYMFLKEAQFLSSDGRCRTFGRDGDGYVPGEGVGAVLLTSLERAEREGYHIYGVIKGTALNHGGKTSGTTVPDPVAQSEVIKDALVNAGINPRTISYVEAHGTGTSLGDPIEIQALSSAFKNWTDDKQFCAIGSIKSNIGHGEGAAGISGITKILLQMKYNELVPSLHSETINPYIPIDDTPFQIIQKPKQWNEMILNDEKIPRRAGISSFGANGSNAHIVLEQYQKNNEIVEEDLVSQGYIILLSAKNKERLKIYAQKLLEYISKNKAKQVHNLDECIRKDAAEILSDIIGIDVEEVMEVKNFLGTTIDFYALIRLKSKLSEKYDFEFEDSFITEASSIYEIVENLKLNYSQKLAEHYCLPAMDKQHYNLRDLAYTLQTGREEMEERVAFVVYSKDELASKLNYYINSSSPEEYFTAHISKKGNFNANTIMQSGDQDSKKKLLHMAKSWVNGESVDWSVLYEKKQPNRLSLPTYPFAEERYWISDNFIVEENMKANAEKIYPLIHKNVSTLLEQKYTSVFTKNEFFLSDHRVKGKMTLPGTVYIEMAVEAAMDAMFNDIKKNCCMVIKNITWLKPLAVEEEELVYTCIIPNHDGSVEFEIYNGSEEKTNIYSQGKIILGNNLESPVVNVFDEKYENNSSIYSADECYKLLDDFGVQYGAAHRGIISLSVNEEASISTIKLPSELKENFHAYLMHPSILDAAFQSIIGYLSKMKISGTVLPYSLDEMVFYDSCQINEYAIVKKCSHNNYKFDILLVTQDGKVNVAINGLEVRAFGSKPFVKNEIVILESDWKQVQTKEEEETREFSNHVVVLFNQSNAYARQVEKYLSKGRKAKVINFNAVSEDMGNIFMQYGNFMFEEIHGYFQKQWNGAMLFQVVCMDANQNSLYGSFMGLLKSAQLENPNFLTQYIQFSTMELSEAELAERLLSSSSSKFHALVYQNDTIYVPYLKETVIKKQNKFSWKNNGVYIITGGMGNIGWIFAKEICKCTNRVTLILTGRSEYSEQIEQKIGELEEKAGIIEYRNIDITLSHQVEELIQYTVKKYGKINGILHCAGINRDNFIIKKTREEFEEVLKPKVLGIVNLDEATKELDLDNVILFSSLAAVHGNEGQSDYAFANAFMEQYSRYRNKLVEEGKRCGKTISINWPLWKTDTGMSVNDSVKKEFQKKLGMYEMDQETGIDAFYKAVTLPKEQVTVIYGEKNKVLTTFTKNENIETKIYRQQVSINISDKEKEAVAKFLLQYLKEVVSEVIKLPVQKIDADSEFEQYGIDSIVIMQLTSLLEKKFGPLPKTLFFEYMSVKELAGYFLENHMDKLLEHNNTKQEKCERIFEPDSPGKFEIISKRRNRFTVTDTMQKEINKPLDIAIIGLAGKYPGAENINLFWNNLKNGVDSITEIPKDRWDWHLYYDKDPLKSGTVNSKWGGFINGAADFDPLFFNISPYEAETMDPQERLFLECVYETLEDGGYTRASLSKYKKDELEGNIGVFVGVMYDEYQLFGGNAGVSGSIANRISYYFNFHGPSIAINTMCSSSLTAVHLACMCLEKGECNVAIAGGVNVSIHPNKYNILGKSNFLSSEGRCRSFGKGGDGYVPGEGVGAILLKPLALAVEDGDNIYGVIKGSAINHGGKANGFTVPNVKSQQNVISSAIREAGISPEQISYMEAHGTGTSLGDPIEVQGLTKAFNRNEQDKQFCILGSVKSNIGHCESAAGIAGITKILLQMKYKQIVPSLHSQELNKNIHFESTPFIVPQELMNWEQTEIDCKKQPRYAGISSFGAGGSNAHIIFEEYVSEVREDKEDKNQTYVIILSAKTKESLMKKAEDLLAYLIDNEKQPVDMKNIAYTLQVGREEMEERLGILACSYKNLKEKLEEFISVKKNIPDVYIGNTKMDQPIEKMFVENRDLKITLEKWMQYREYELLLTLWVKGISIEWNKLYCNERPRKVSLPTYPFEKIHCWYAGGKQNVVEGGVEKLYPMIHKNISTLAEQKFSSVFTGKEYFFQDHRVKGTQLLPGAGYIEMALEAMSSSMDENYLIKLNNVIWGKPLMSQDAVKGVNTCIYSCEKNYGFEIYYEDNEKLDIFSQGNIQLCKEVEKTKTNLGQLLNTENYEMIKGESCYDIFSRLGIEYGPAHRVLKELMVKKDCVITSIQLPACIQDEYNRYILHPTVLDAAFQSIIGMFDWNTLQETLLPVSLDELIIFGECESEMWAVVKKDCGNNFKFDIQLVNNDGEIILTANGLTVAYYSGARKEKHPDEIIMLETVWKKEEFKIIYKERTYSEQIVIFLDKDDSFVKKVESELKIQRNARAFSLNSEKLELGDKFTDIGKAVFLEIKACLHNKKKGKILLQVVSMKGESQPLYRSIGSLLKSASFENPDCVTQMIEIEGSHFKELDLAKILVDCSYMNHAEVRYLEDGKYTPQMKEIKNKGNEGKQFKWKDKGVYVITGGLGYLGWMLAEEINKNSKDTVIILTGRSQYSNEIQEKLEYISGNGGIVEYISMNISSRKETEACIQYIMKTYGKINGILHCAGISKDNFIIKKSEEEFLNVLEPKIKGLVNLDEAAKDVELDFLVVYSSLSAVHGNQGQSDYAYANAFADRYTAYRNELMRQGRRKGKAVAINWSLWKMKSGMSVNEDVKNELRDNFGIVEIEPEEGLNAFYQILGVEKEEVTVIKGNRIKVLNSFCKNDIEDSKVKEKVVQKTVTKESNIDIAKAKKELYQYLKGILSEVTKLPVDMIEEDCAFDNYGVDSVMIIQMTKNMENKFGLLPKTLFFEYLNICQLAEYFLENHLNKLIRPTQIEEEKEIEQDACTNTEIQIRSRRYNRFSVCDNSGKNKEEALNVAIIGLAGKYPGADNINKFWENLKNGVDSITEIPKERWDWKLYYDEDKKIKDKINSRWGGFINGVADFDPLFFNLSPYEAELLDPQERLFLECVYETLEDSGYTRESLGDYNSGGLEGCVGVFAGVMYDEYQLYGAKELENGRMTGIGGVNSSIANRISYYFNFHGPSMAVNTMCSSSLTAIHLACMSLAKQECDVAIAGGVNVSIHPNKYVSLGTRNFLSSKGKCESFGKGGDGYVPGEGVGAVLLKPLDKAIKDGDNIYGVIKGSALNHGGKVNGFTVPNVRAQKNVISRALRESGIEARQISYIEAHGTGTKLGDPIEIQGLTEAFSKDTEDKQYCTIGSVKSNIGHCESAAGIAGITKILLQMKHKQIAPSLHSEELNENIDFKQTPFCVPQKLKEWEVDHVKQPRYAGISSFGAGGSNAHIIIEEFIPKENMRVEIEQTEYAFVLSAKTQEKLIKKAEDLLEFVKQHKNDSISLADIAYTLQIGRDSFEERFAMIIHTYDELCDKLEAFINGQLNQSDMHIGNIRDEKATVKMFKENQELHDILVIWMENRKYNEILSLWVKGVTFNWNLLYSDVKPKRISLPTYPFERVHCWFSASEIKEGQMENDAAKKYSLLHDNMSTLVLQKFSTTLKGNEFYVENHKESRYLPGTVYLELALEATLYSFEKKIEDGVMVKLQDVVCYQPVIWKDAIKKVYTSIIQNSEEEINYVISETENRDNDNTPVLSSGIIEYYHYEEKIQIDIEALIRRCKLITEELEQHYGKKYIGQNEVISEISIPEFLASTFDKYVIHPFILAKALLSGGILTNKHSLMEIVSIKEVDIMHKFEQKMYSWVQYNNELNTAKDSSLHEFNILLCDGKGMVCAKLNGVVLKNL